ncbi:MAG: alpha/beta hydrolase [Candidatus Cloacimonetes bacterium 4572_55]|nr:MAG: alpha/beta hydrolase [Candidatus Cloacimonetes bacterium 4572_55]
MGNLHQKKRIDSIRSEYPFASHWLHIDGLKYHYLDQGNADAPPIVMLHGNPTWSFYYRKLIPELSKKFRVIAPDHIGCGLSDKPQDYPYTLESHIHNVTLLIDRLHLKNIRLAVHDWGGAIGMGYATRNPENVARLVIFNTAAFFEPVIPKRIQICRIPKLGKFLVRGLNGFALAALIFATSRHKRFTREVRAGYLFPYNNWSNRVAIHRFVSDIPMEDDHPTRAVLDQIEARLPLLRDRPALIIWGEDDFCFTTKNFLSRWEALFPQAEIKRIAGAGHYVVEDAYEEILPLLARFL